jgi:hypothetical protein
MIEFTLSRVCLSICGLVLLAAVIVPVMGMYESHTSEMESDVSDDIASLIDEFHYSKMEVFTVAMSDILPNTLSYIEFNGHMIILTTERGVYKSGMNAMVIVKDENVFGHGDILRLTKVNGAVIAEKLA